MSRVVPNKLTAYNPLPTGVSNKNLVVEYASIIPANSSGGASFTPSGTSRILFRVPAFQNSFLDNSRSSLSFTFKVDSDATDTSGNGNILNPKLGTTTLFKRMQIKSPNGLVIEDIQDLFLLNKVLFTMRPASDTRHLEGIVTGDNFMDYHLTSGNKDALLTLQKTGVKYQYYFNTGILSRHLQAYLPLHSMNGGNTGLAFSIELWLNDNYNVLQKLGSGSASTTKAYSLTDVKYNMTLLKADKSIVDRFNNLANDSSEIIIPFTTYRSYTNNISTQKSSLQITEACSDLRRVHTLILKDTTPTEPETTNYSTNTQFIGGIDNTDNQVSSYQLQVGSHFIYTEPIESSNDNSDLLQQVVNASFSKAPIVATRLQNSNFKPQYQDEFFSLTSTFCYENPSQFNNGISLGSLPLVMRIDLASSPTSLYCLTFSELGFNLSIKDGYMNVVDRKDIEDFGY
jgi:hypothetical protein